MPYTATTKLPLLRIFQWATPTGLNPRLLIPIGKTDTTIIVSFAPVDETGAHITGNFLFGIASKGYVENCYAPAGSVSGTTITGVIRGVRLANLDYTTGDSTLAVDHFQDDAVFCQISPVHGTMIVAALQGDVGTGKNNIAVGDLTASDVSITAQNDQVVKTKLYYDESAQRWRTFMGDDGPNAGNSIEFTIPTGTTAQLAALLELPAGGMVAYDTTLGKTVFREGSAWVQNAAGGTVANASETVAGKVELATNAEMGAGTSTGGSGARLVPPNDQLVKTSSGAGDENKLPVLNASGKLADGFVSKTSVEQHRQFPVTLGEAIASAGTGLRLAMHDGLAYKWTDTRDFRLFTPTGQTNIGLQSNPGALLANTGRLFTYRVTTNKFLFLYETAANSWSITCGTIASGKWTVGVAQVVGTGSACAPTGVGAVAVLDATHFGIVFKNTSDNKIYAQICTIATNTITAGAAVAESATTSYTDPSICATGTAGTLTFAVAANNTTTDNKVWGITIAGTVPTWGAAVAVEATVIGTAPMCIRNGENRILIVYQKTATVFKAAHVTQTDNTTTVVVDTLATIYTAGANTVSPLLSLYRLADDKHLLYLNHTNAGNDYFLYSFIVTVATTTPSTTGAVLLDTYTAASQALEKGPVSGIRIYGSVDFKTLTGNYGALVLSNGQKNDTESVIAYRTYARCVWVDFSGTTPVFKFEPFRIQMQGQNAAINYAMALTFEDTFEYTPYLHYGDVAGNVASAVNKIATVQIAPNHIIGWAQASGAASASISCDPFEDANQTGLVAGKIYTTAAAGALQDGLSTNGGQGKPVAFALPGSTTAVRRLWGE